MRRLGPLLCSVATLVLASPASAEPITYRFEVEVSSVGDIGSGSPDDPGLLAMFPVGSTSYLDWTWDADGLIDPLGVGQFRAPTKALTFWNERGSATPPVTLWNYWTNYGDGSGFFAGADLYPRGATLTSSGLGPIWFQIGLNYADGTFDPAVLPSGLPGGLVSGSFDMSFARDDGHGNYSNLQGVSGRIVSSTAVPEPGTLAVMALGLAGAYMQRRRLRSRS